MLCCPSVSSMCPWCPQRGTKLPPLGSQPTLPVSSLPSAPKDLSCSWPLIPPGSKPVLPSELSALAQPSAARALGLPWPPLQTNSLPGAAPTLPPPLPQPLHLQVPHPLDFGPFWSVDVFASFILISHQDSCRSGPVSCAERCLPFGDIEFLPMENLS